MGAVASVASTIIGGVGKAVSLVSGAVDVGTQVVGVGNQIFNMFKSTPSGNQVIDNFQQVYQSLSKNYEAITNVEETIDRMMAQSQTSFASLDDHISKSTTETLDAISDVEDKVDRNFVYLLQIFKVTCQTYSAVEKVRREMHDEFERVLAASKSSRIEPIITKLNNFVQYFEIEKLRIGQLPRDQRITTLLEENGFLSHLREARTPRGDSLRTFIFEVINQNYAIPENGEDKVAFCALSALFYGTRTQISVMSYLVQQYIYLADHFYREQDIVNFNKRIDDVVTVFHSFRDSLIGGGSDLGLIGQVINILKKVDSFAFDFNWIFDDREGKKISALASERIKSLEEQKQQLDAARLPVLSEVPGKLTAQIKFDKEGPNTPLGPWEDRAKVSYAVQHRSPDNLYSKVGEWSTPFTVKGRANPRLRVPASSTYTRLIFRQFNNDEPQFAGIIERGETEFRDIDRDLYNAASRAEEQLGIEEAELLISHGANMNATFDMGRCSVHAAAQSGNVELAKNILMNHHSINAEDINGNTPLHVAALEGWDTFVKMMIDVGSNINAKNKSGSTPLHLAVANGHIEVVHALLTSPGLDVNAQDNDGASPLHKAVLSGIPDIVQTLLQCSCTDVNIQTLAGLTPLHLSAMVEYPEITDLLLQHCMTKANIQAAGHMTALHLATITGNIPVMQRLICLVEINVDVQSVNGWTPLHYAISFDHSEAVAVLLGAEYINTNIFGTGQLTPLHIAAMAGQSNVVYKLLARGALLGLQREDGLTAHDLAELYKKEDVVKTLSGAKENAAIYTGTMDVHRMARTSINNEVKFHGQGNARNKPVFTQSQDLFTMNRENTKNARISIAECPKVVTDAKLIEAAEMGRLDAVRYLLQKGVNINTIDSKGETALHKAAARGHVELVKHLLANGADMNIKSTDGHRLSSLNHAANHGQLEVVKYMVLNGAPVNNQSGSKEDFFTLVTSYDMSLLHWAAHGGNPILVEFLLDKGAIIDAKDHGGETPLHKAAYRGLLNVVKCLVERGADINARRNEGETALHWAAWNGYLAMAKYLIEKGAKLNIETINGETPLMYAKQRGHHELAEYIRDQN